MQENEIEKIAEKSDMIVAGYSFTFAGENKVRVLNLYNPLEKCLLLTNGDVVESTMAVQS